MMSSNVFGSDVQENTVKRSNMGSNSFAYTSGKNVPKYSPARNFKPGQQNVPMSYAGPPNEEEMMRHRNRHQTGNRNFPEPVAVQQPKQRPMTAKGKGGKKGGPRQRVQTAKPQQDYDKIWKQ